MPWHTIDFYSPYYADHSQITATFCNDTPNPVIYLIELIIYYDGTRRICIRADNGVEYDRLLAQLSSIPAPLSQEPISFDGNRYLAFIPRSVVNPLLATYLLRAAQAIDQSFEQIREPINEILGVQINGRLGSYLPYMAPLPPPPFVQSAQQMQARNHFMEDETHARNIMEARADHARNDIVRARNLAERHLNSSAESADTCGICLINPATWTCNEYNIVRFMQPTRRARLYVCNNCEPTLRAQILSNGMPTYQDWIQYIS